MDRKPIKIFRAGTFTSMEGRQVSFNEADLRAIADAYDRQSDPAPLVIGHPKVEDMAYGWVDKLQVSGGDLEAMPDQVEPAFAEFVNAGRYPKLSAQFYPPEHAANPKPGSWYLKHVGFLGAHPPGVKGLGTVQFNEGADQAPLVTIESEDIMKTEQETSFAEREAELAAREQQLQDRETSIAAREQSAAQAERDAAHAANVSFAEGMIGQAKLAPAGKELVVGLLDQLDVLTPVSFGEAGELAPAAALKKLFEGAQPLVSLGEHVKPGDDGKTTVTISFAAPQGHTVDPAAAELHAKATAIRAENPELSWMEAVKRVQAAG